MKVLIANLGSTSLKYRLLEMQDETELARGGVERIGDKHSRSYCRTGQGEREEHGEIADHGEALQQCFELLCGDQLGCLNEIEEIDAIGFKASTLR